MQDPRKPLRQIGAGYPFTLKLVIPAKERLNIGKNPLFHGSKDLLKFTLRHINQLNIHLFPCSSRIEYAVSAQSPYYDFSKRLQILKHHERLQHLNLYLDNAITNISDGAEGGFGEIDNTPAFKGATIIDLDYHALAVGEVGHPHHGAKG